MVALKADTCRKTTDKFIMPTQVNFSSSLFHVVHNIIKIVPSISQLFSLAEVDMHQVVHCVVERRHEHCIRYIL